MTTPHKVLDLPETDNECGIIAHYHEEDDGWVNITAYCYEQGGDCDCYADLMIPYGSLINLMANIKSALTKGKRS